MADINWPEEFGRWLDQLEDAARSGNEHLRLILAHTARALDQLRTPRAAWRRGRNSDAAGAAITPSPAVARLPRFHEGVAVRLICWFPPDTGTVVVALFAADKAKLGDVFYDGVAARADPMIDHRKRETHYEEKP